MPDLGIGEILAIAGLVASAGGTAASLYAASQAPNQQQAQRSAQQAAAQEALIQKEHALTAAGPNAQAATSGSLTGPAGQSFIDILAGYPGTTGSAQPNPGSTPTSNTNASPAATPGAAPNFQSILEQLKSLTGSGGEKFSGGWQDQPPTPYQPFSLAPGY